MATRKRSTPKEDTAPQAAEAGSVVAIPVDLTIYHAADLKNQLQAAVAAGPRLTLDLAAVTEIDSSGVQLLLATQKELQAAGHTLVLSSVPECVQQLFTLYRLPLPQVA